MVLEISLYFMNPLLKGCVDYFSLQKETNGLLIVKFGIFMVRFVWQVSLIRLNTPTLGGHGWVLVVIDGNNMQISVVKSIFFNRPVRTIADVHIL